MKVTLALLLGCMLAVSPAMAQDAPLVSLTPENLPRWDAAALTGWLGANRSGIAVEWDDWSQAAAFGAAVGYYWTPHIKITGDAAATTWGSVTVQETFVVPGQPFPSFRIGEHRFRSVRASASVAYQFLENTWFHPYVSVGIEAVRESRRFDLQESPICGSVFCPPIRATGEAASSYRARPLAGAGFKWYVSERAFIRSELRAAFGVDRTESVHWLAGIGADF